MVEWQSSACGGSLGRFGVVVGLHRWEQKHLLDVIRVRQQHRQPVDTYAPSSSGREAIFESVNEAFVNPLSFLVTSVLGIRLRLEALKLHFRVVQLRVGVDQLVLVGKQLKSLSETFFRTVPLGEGTHQLGVVDNEARADALGLEELADQFIDQTSCGARCGAVNVAFNAKFVKELTSFLCLEFASAGQGHTHRLFEAFHHLDAAERRSEIDVVDFVGVGGVILRVILDDVGSANGLHHLRKQLFRKGHQVIVVGVGPIELAGGELWVVRQVDAFVTELLANLEHAIHAAHNQHLQVELRSDTHEQLHVKVVVESLEGLSSGTSWNHVHHGSLNLDEVASAEEIAQKVENLISRVENLLDWVVQDQVEVALAVARVLRQHLRAVFGGLGHHVHAVGEADDFAGAHRQLVGLRTSGTALNSDDVTATQGRVQHGEITLVRISLSQNLHLCTIAFQVNENQCGTGSTDGHNSTSESHSHILHELVRLSDPLFILSAEFVDPVCASELVRVRIHTLFADTLNKVLPVLCVLRGVLLFLLKCRGQVFLLRLIALSCCQSSSLLSFSGSFLLGCLRLFLTLLCASLELTSKKKFVKLLRAEIGVLLLPSLDQA